MDNAGVIGGNEVFQDRETGSRWQQSSLQAISGPLKGERLELYPFLLTDWNEWHRLHPDTLVLKPLPGYADRIPERNEMIRQGLSGKGVARSEEHTSELQSRLHLVCRLLLEIKLEYCIVTECGNARFKTVKFV